MDCIKELTALLPYPLRALIDRGDPPEELRLYAGRRAVTVKNGRVSLTPLVCTKELMKETLDLLTNRSFYSHADTIRRGFLPLPCGVRAGIAGNAAAEVGEVRSLEEVTFLCIRIPRAVPGAADALFSFLQKRSFRDSVIVCSPPGVGKTTVLRELARRLSSAPCFLPTALIDERGELSHSLQDCPLLTVYLYYPKARALEIALRTASPRFLIADEIGEEDLPALSACGRGGVPFAVSMHAGSLKELYGRKNVSSFLEGGLFDLYTGLTRDERGLHFDFQFLREEKP